MKKKNINMEKQNMNAEQGINKQDINKEQDKDKKLEKIEKFNSDEPINDSEKANNEGVEAYTDDEVIEIKREIEYLCSQPQTPQTIKTIKLYRASLVPIYNKEKNDWIGGSGKVDERTPKGKGYDGKDIAEKPVDQKPLAEKTVDQKPLAEKTVDQNELKKESPMDFVVSTMETDMPSYCDPED